MNYEKFNDAMVRLRQAEESLNKAFRDVYKVIYVANLKDDCAENIVQRYSENTSIEQETSELRQSQVTRKVII